MDEPLGALDKQLREQMQLEIRRLHAAPRRDDGLRHARPGRGADDVGPHRRVPSRPRSSSSTARAASTRRRRTRSSPASSARTTVSTAGSKAVAGDRCTIRIAGDALDRGSLASPLPAGAPVTVSLRPERVQIARAGHTIAGDRRLPARGTLREVIYLGDHVRARVVLPGNDDFTVKRPIDEAQPVAGDRRGGRACLGARALPGIRAGRRRDHNVSRRRTHA